MNKVAIMNNYGWWRAGTLAFSIFGLSLGYEYLTTPEFTESTYRRLLADVALLLIGYSITLPSLALFLKRELKDTLYRKELGQIGFWFVCAHVFTTILLSKLTITEALLPYTAISGILSILAFGIFALMSLVSIPVLKNALGHTWWLKIIRLGLWAFTLGLIHGTMKGALHIINWRPLENPYPPLSLIVLILATMMFGLHSYYRYQKNKSER